MSKNQFLDSDVSYNRGPIGTFGVPQYDEGYGVEDPLPYEQPVSADVPLDAPGQKAGPDTFFPAEPMEYETDAGRSLDSIENMARDMLMPEAAQSSYEPGADQDLAESSTMQDLDRVTLQERAHQMLQEIDPQEAGPAVPGQMNAGSQAPPKQGLAAMPEFQSGTYLALGLGVAAAATLLLVARGKPSAP